MFENSNFLNECGLPRMGEAAASWMNRAISSERPQLVIFAVREFQTEVNEFVMGWTRILTWRGNLGSL